MSVIKIHDREFVKTIDNVTWLKPKMTFRQVIQKYGYPFVSKEVAHKMHDWQTSHSKGKRSYVDDQLAGNYVSKNGKTNMVSIKKWAFLTDAPFDISHKCCNVMKKTPVKKYNTETGRKAFTGLIANESTLRTQNWLKYGCNAFTMKNPQSNPMAFWTEQDVLNYIKINQIPIASVYGDIEIDYEALDQEKGQMTFSDLLGIPETFPLKTTGCQRTGCMFCGFGCHLNNDQRFCLMKKTHPKQYDYIMRPESQGGLNYKEIIDWLNEHGNLNIKY